MKISLITILCILTFVVSVQAEPVVDSDGYLTITWDIPTNHSTLTGYFIRIYNSDGDIKHQGETMLTRYDWDYSDNFIPGEVVTVKIWALGIYVDAVGNIKPLKSSYTSIDVALNENTLLTAPNNLTVN